jgi:hypothetical protein
MIDETAGKSEVKQCRSHPVGESWDESDMINETAWQRNKAVSLTFCLRHD